MHAFQQARFSLSAAQPQDVPPKAGGELVFAGRSNVGKSSAINALAGRKRLAFASKTPGRTRMLNFFELADGARLVDLPGYGYAAAPRALRATWDTLIGAFLTGRGEFAGIVLLTDARRPLAPGDRQFLDWLGPVDGPRLVLISKADKLSRNERAKTLARTQGDLAKSGIAAQVMLFSAKSGEGVEETRDLLEKWLAQTKNPR